MEGTVFSISPNRSFGLIKHQDRLISFMFSDITDANDKASISVGDSVTFKLKKGSYREVAVDVSVKKEFMNIFL